MPKRLKSKYGEVIYRLGLVGGEKAFEIMSVQAKPRFKGRGYETKIVDGLLEELRGEGKMEMLLSPECANDVALKSFPDITKKHKMYWKKRDIDWSKAYWTPEHPHRQVIVNILNGYTFNSVLEVGCGVGANLYCLKKALPHLKIAGCDINPQAIEEAKRQFEERKIELVDKEIVHTQKKEEKDISWIDRYANKINLRSPEIDKVDFKVGDITGLPFHGASFDLVLTDACLIYVGPKKIDRALREIRRVGARGGYVMFVEFHSSNIFQRQFLRMVNGYYAYDYKKLLEEHNFKGIKLFKFPEDVWHGEPWETMGYIITAAI